MKSGYEPKVNANGTFGVLPLYCCALYLQMQELKINFHISMPKAQRGGISGISHNGFTPKDLWMLVWLKGKNRSLMVVLIFWG